MILYLFYKSILLDTIFTNQFVKNKSVFQKSLKTRCPPAKSHHLACPIANFAL